MYWIIIASCAMMLYLFNLGGCLLYSCMNEMLDLLENIQLHWMIISHEFYTHTLLGSVRGSTAAGGQAFIFLAYCSNTIWVNVVLSKDQLISMILH